MSHFLSWIPVFTGMTRKQLGDNRFLYVHTGKQFAGRGSKAINFLPKEDNGRPDRGKSVFLYGN